MYFFEQLLYEAAIPMKQQQVPPQPLPLPQPKPAIYQQKPQEQKPQEQQFDNLDFTDADVDTEGEGNGDISQDPYSSLIPIKRYYLIQKLFNLNDKLNQLRIKNDVLNLVISFIDSFSYESLLMLTNKLVEEIYLQVKDNSETKETS